jgi:hypothetical protein
MSDGSTSAPAGANRQRQAAVILSEIGLLAMCVERFGIMLVQEPEDERDVAALQIGIKAIAGHIGLISDVGSRLCGGFTWHQADATQWLLPPSYHVDADGGEQQ